MISGAGGDSIICEGGVIGTSRSAQRKRSAAIDGVLHLIIGLGLIGIRPSDYDHRCRGRYNRNGIRGQRGRVGGDLHSVGRTCLPISVEGDHAEVILRIRGESRTGKAGDVCGGHV